MESQSLKRFSITAITLAGVMALSGTALAQRATLSDAQVQSNVLRAMANDQKLANQPIQSTTAFGTVTLTGAVSDEASRDLAEKTVSRTEGVKKVVDQLSVGDQAMAQAQQQMDAGQAALQQDESQTSQQQQNVQQGGQAQYAQGDPNAQGQYQGPSQQRPRLYRRDYERQMAQQQQQGNGQQQGYSQPPYGGQQAYGQQPQGNPGGARVTVPAGTPIQVRLNHWLSSGRVQQGTGFNGFVANDVVAGNEIAIPRGATVRGTVVDVTQPGALAGKGSLTLQLDSVQLGGRVYPLTSEPWTIDGRDKVGKTVGSTAFGAIFGALIGGAVGGGAGAAAGAGIGGVAGLGASAATGGGEAVIPGEAMVNFRLAQPSNVVTVSEAEMQRLGDYAGPASAYQRPPSAYYGGPGYYGPYPYAYPAIGIGIGYPYYYGRPYYRGYYGPRYRRW
jgi:hypothetical protein